MSTRSHQVGAIIVEGNSELAGFQPNVAVVATWIFGLYYFDGRRMDKVSCHMNHWTSDQHDGAIS